MIIYVMHVSDVFIHLEYHTCCTFKHMQVSATCMQPGYVDA